MKKLLVIMLLVFLIPASLTEARDNEFKREITVDLTNPIDNSNANAKLYLSLTELSGKGLDILNKKFSLDDYLAGRIGQTFAATYVAGFSGYFSHEFAHTREWRRYGEYHWDINWKDWSIGVPRFVTPLIYIPTREQKLRIIAAGLNQEEYDALLINQKTPTGISFVDALSFILRKFSAPAYDLYSNLAVDASKTGDLSLYSQELKNSGINLSTNDIKTQALIASLLSFKSWDSLFSVINYLKDGQRVSNSTLLHFPNGYRLSLPLIQYIMTEKGGYYNFHSTLITRKHSVDLSLGTDLDFIWTGKVDNLRFGGKINNLFSLGSVEFSPFGYLNLKRTELSYTGSLIGTEAEWKITKDFSLTGEIAGNHNDLVEKSEGNENGLIFNVGLSYKF